MPTNHARTEAHAPSREDLVDAARSWSCYLDELAWCARRGKVTGSEMPEIPLQDLLDGLHDAV
jgi:hypothetical protein